MDDKTVKLEMTAPKVDVLQTILLDEISGKLGDLIELINSTIPSGGIVTIKIDLGAGEDKIIYYDSYAPHPFFSATIINDGDGAIYFGVNARYDTDNILYKGDILPIDMKKSAIRFFHIKSIDTATTVRIICLY